MQRKALIGTYASNNSFELPSLTYNNYVLSNFKHAQVPIL